MFRAYAAVCLLIAVLWGSTGAAEPSPEVAPGPAPAPAAASEAPPAPAVEADPTDPEAQFEQGMRYQLGKGVEKDHAESVKWFRKAAEQGHMRAQLQLGFAYQRGRGIEKNEREALRWIRKSAAQGHPRAQLELAIAYREGRGLPKDPVRAMMWFIVSAKGGGIAAGVMGSNHARTLKPKQRQEARELANAWQADFARKTQSTEPGTLPPATPEAAGSAESPAPAQPSAGAEAG